MIPVRNVEPVQVIQEEFILVPTCSSVLVYMIPVQNVGPVQVILVQVHSGSHIGMKLLYWYEIWPHSVPVPCKGGTRFRSGVRWVTELTGTGRAHVSMGNNASKWLVRTRAHMKLCVIPVKWLPRKHSTKLDFVLEWNSYWYVSCTHPLKSNPFHKCPWLWDHIGGKRLLLIKTLKRVQSSYNILFFLNSLIIIIPNSK